MSENMLCEAKQHSGLCAIEGEALAVVLCGLVGQIQPSIQHEALGQVGIDDLFGCLGVVDDAVVHREEPSPGSARKDDIPAVGADDFLAQTGTDDSNAGRFSH